MKIVCLDFFVCARLNSKYKLNSHKCPSLIELTFRIVNIYDESRYTMYLFKINILPSFGK